ncbi:MAG: DUF4157 domain-containing protein [Proteobacteria bacterium]|nr:DUF4157 domain-containing protein [Pseudomonadota bacterium]
MQFKVDASSSSQVQFHGDGGGGDVHSTAKGAFQGGGSALPHQSSIESSFGADMSSVQAYTGPAASAACESLGAQAFTMGNKIAFADNSPSVQLAAHEAAHVVQQAQGVSLSGGVGQAGDKYEVAADSAAAAVVQNKDASGDLGVSKGGGDGGVQKKEITSLQLKESLQFLGPQLGEDLPEGQEAPAHLDTDKQRKWSVDQYVEMWEKEQGRTMTKAEKKTLARGCIGIVALNLSGGGNPPLNHCFDNFDAAMKLVKTWNDFIDKHRGETTADGQVIGQNWKAVLFAKLFWSNQSPKEEDRKKGDPDAFKGDPDNDGRIDMEGYEYRAQPKMINFDYAFWDEGGNCFWHANHCEPGMQVYQSTKGKFAAGYTDFDRIAYCAGIATNYKPAASAAAH